MEGKEISENDKYMSMQDRKKKENKEIKKSISIVLYKQFMNGGDHAQ